jgi:hypothetical protein
MKILSEYSLQITRSQPINLPPDALFVGVGTDPTSPEEPLMWVIHEQIFENTPLWEHGIVMCQAGAQFPDDLRLNPIGHFTIRGGTQSIHVFSTPTFKPDV